MQLGEVRRRPDHDIQRETSRKAIAIMHLHITAVLNHLGGDDLESAEWCSQRCKKWVESITFGGDDDCLEI